MNEYGDLPLSLPLWPENEKKKIKQKKNRCILLILRETYIAGERHLCIRASVRP